MMEQNSVITIFCCYAHKDKDLLEDLRTHLSPLQRQNVIQVWYDGDIIPGTEWDSEIKKHLNDAKIILLLISADLIKSDYCYSVEMRQAMVRYNQGDAKVIPVVLRPVDGWENVSPLGDIKLGDLQALPAGAKAVSTWENSDSAWKDVVKGIERVVNGLLTRGPVWPAKLQTHIVGRKMTVLELIGLVAALITIIAFAMKGISTINSWIDSLRPPTTLTFFFLFFCALVAAISGAVLWYLLNYFFHLTKPTGSDQQENALDRSISLESTHPDPQETPYQPTIGDDVEPHGIAACIWSLSTNVPTVLILVIINWNYRFTSIPYQLLLYGTFLVGATIGSLILYDFPLWGNKGFRNYFKSKHLAYYSREFWLAILWSLLISSLGFLAMGLAKFIAVKGSDFVTPILQIGFCVGLTTSAIVIYIMFFPDEPKFGQGRGIIAALALRMTLFFGLILGTGSVNIPWV